jgi:hypothetical protein
MAEAAGRTYPHEALRAAKKFKPPGKPLPLRRSSVIRPTFVARLNKGCRGGDHADIFYFGISRAFSTL